MMQNITSVCGSCLLLLLLLLFPAGAEDACVSRHAGSHLQRQRQAH
jgi:hypothetical protein